MKKSDAFEKALDAIRSDAVENSFKHPKFTTLLEEFCELVLSLRDKHHHKPELEIIQIGGIAINLLSQIYESGEDTINNIKHCHNK